MSILKDNNRNIVNKALIDSFGRVARKLRISVIDRCNMQCIYCMPRNGDKKSQVKWLPKDELLNYHEFLKVSRIMARLGVEKIRITGGEPLLRPRVEDLISGLSKINEIRSISMTTNGLFLGEKADLLKKSGLQSVNISLDTFKPSRFKAICGVDGLHKVLNSIAAAENAGLNVKINTVVIRGWNDDELVDFANFARKTGHIVRFIEFMPLDGSGIWSPDLIVSKSEIISRLIKEIGDMEAASEVINEGNNNSNTNSTILRNDEKSAPAKLYSFIDGKGTLGFIASMTEPFCAQCDRVRITSDGRLLTCLFENPGYDIKNLLRNAKTDQEIAMYILECMQRKPEGIINIIRSKSLKPTLNLMHTIGG